MKPPERLASITRASSLIARAGSESGSVATSGAPASPDSRSSRRLAIFFMFDIRLERGVARHEARVNELTHELEDPELYTTPNGTKRAKSLGGELDAAKRSLDKAISGWEKAVEAAERAAV